MRGLKIFWLTVENKFKLPYHHFCNLFTIRNFFLICKFKKKFTFHEGIRVVSTSQTCFLRKLSLTELRSSKKHQTFHLSKSYIFVNGDLLRYSHITKFFPPMTCQILFNFPLVLLNNYFPLDWSWLMTVCKRNSPYWI